jgi:hypothetical protein
MTIGKTPVNQLNALPLQDADSAAAGGQIQVVGGSMVRFFDANTLALNGVPMTTFTAGGFSDVGLVTPFLNCVGCTKYMVAIRTTNVGARGALPTIHVQAQMRMGASDNPAVVYANAAGLQQAANAWIFLSSTGLVFPATVAGNEPQTILFAWESTAASNSNPGQFTVFGSDIRFLFSTTGAVVAAQNLFSVNIWAQT